VLGATVISIDVAPASILLSTSSLIIERGSGSEDEDRRRCAKDGGNTDIDIVMMRWLEDGIEI
jgi:hypothetical protein